MKKIFEFISHNNLRAGDAVELICPVAGFPKHYAIFMGLKNGTPAFVANMVEGVRLVRNRELSGFLAKYQVTRIERFPGSEMERKHIIRRALSRIGERAYCFVFNNCEHFKNWVLYGDSKSYQVVKISAGIAAGGLGLLLVGSATNSRGIQKIGMIALISLLIIFLLAWVILENKRTHK